MSVFNDFAKNVSSFAKTTALGVMALVATSCGGDDPVNPEPGPGTGPSTGTVYNFQDNGSGARIYTKDSLVVFYAGGSEITVSVRQADLNKGNNVKVTTPLFSPDNIKEVKNGAVRLVDYNLDTDVVSFDKKYIGSSGKDKLEKAKVLKMGLIGARADANDNNYYVITKEDVLGIVKLLDKPVALVGHKAIADGKTFDLKPTN